MKVAREIVAIFSDGREVVYTRRILGLLISDMSVVRIIDRETGALIYERENRV